MKCKFKSIYKIISALLLISVTVTIFLLSHQNGSESTETSSFVTKLLSFVFGNNIPEAIVRTFGHFSEFAALGFLSLNCFYAFRDEIKPVLCAVLSWCYALTDEIHQIFIDGRAFQIQDLLVDLAGIITGTVLILIILNLMSLINKRSENQ